MLVWLVIGYADILWVSMANAAAYRRAYFRLLTCRHTKLGFC
ncbi:hypothetical protein MGSAQ_001804 [marine sediment metagenome]|uniref:Uncharacterized protein n=1 Tax=marine sediment metagenome TaxID=412755 RepID=A0A1B6NT83_9ZZZZ